MEHAGVGFAFPMTRRPDDPIAARSDPAESHRLFHLVTPVALLFLACMFLNSVLTAQTISGRVQNQSTQAPAAGDEVMLLKLGEGMQEEERTKTDAQGAFVLNRNDASAQYVIRVLHQGVNYDQTVAAKAPLDLRVFDAVSRIPGLMGAFGFVEIETEDNTLKVREKFSIVNNSNPPVTQANANNFEISVPQNATVELAEVKGPGGIWVKVSPETVAGRKDIYRVKFPLRPGNTLFMFSYQLPYTGSATFRLKLPYPIKKGVDTGVGVVLPSSMSFKALLPGTFEKPIVSDGLLREKVAKELANEVPPFEVSGSGKAPPPSTTAQVAPPVAARPPSATPHSPQQNPVAASDSSRGGLWFMLAGIVAILAMGVYAIWRIRKKIVAPVVAPSDSLLESLKEQLFHLESDRLR